MEDDAPIPSAIPFSFDETKAVLQVWGSPEIQNLFTLSKRHAHIWNKISEQVYELGITENSDPKYPRRSGKSVKTRFNNKKADYNKVKSRLKSGASADVAKAFPFYDDFEKVLGSKPSVTGEYAVDSMDDADPENTASGFQDSDEDAVVPQKKSKKSTKDKDDWQEKLVECQEKSFELNHQRFEGEKKMVDAMTRFFDAGSRYYEKKIEKLETQLFTID